MSGSKFNYPKAIEPCHPGAARTIFDGSGNEFTLDPKTIRLLSDRVLIRDVPQDDSERNGIVIPQMAQHDGVGKSGLLRIGVVVATGPGDRFIEHGLDAQGVVRRTLIDRPCPYCDGMTCPFCNDGRLPVIVPPQCRQGQTVIYDRYRSEEVIINGQRYQLSHAEQTVIAVLEDDEA